MLLNFSTTPSIFQSTLPIQGETNDPGHHRTDRIFQSTLPIQGETRVLVQSCYLICISIHSPYTGRDFSVRTNLLLLSISIHSPYTGRDTGDYAGGNKMSIFQSTLPIQGETNVGHCSGGFSIFQSTLPIQGETAILHIKLLIYSQSLMQNAKQKNFFQHLHNKL